MVTRLLVRIRRRITSYNVCYTKLLRLFLARFARQNGKPVASFAPDALRALNSYRFPGNVRELENIVERAVILCEGTEIAPSDLFMETFQSLREKEGGAEGAGTGDGASGGEPWRSKAGRDSLSIREAERQAVIAALERNGGHRERTARDLGISRRTLLNKMREFDLFSDGR